MTGSAIVLLIVAICTLFAASNVQVGWLYALGDVFFGFLLASIVLAIWSVLGVRAVARAQNQAEQDTPLELGVDLESRGLVARTFLALMVPPVGRRRLGLRAWLRLSPADWPAVLIERLAPGGWLHVDIRVPTPRRGVFEAPAVYLQSSPLGLMFWRRRIAVPGEVVVTPRVLPIEGLPWFRSDSKGGEEHPMARTVPHGEMIRSTRDYRSGDPLRTIHWRGTARAGRLVVKETEGAAIAGGATVLLDLAGHTEEGLEHAIQVAASLLAHLDEQGLIARLITQEGEFGGPLDLQLEALARAEATVDGTWGRLLPRPQTPSAFLARVLLELDPAGLIVISSRDAGWRSICAH